MTERSHRPEPAAGKRIVRANGVDLCVETFGDPAEPAILLLGGATSSMDRWEDGFCRRLAAGGRFVIRYDQRDTGQSVTYPPGAPGYSHADLAADAVALLGRLGAARAHVVGVSMGGGVAQRMAVEHSARVASLTLVSTSPAGPGAPGLPAVSDRLQAVFAEPERPKPDWSDRQAVIDYIIAVERPFAGSRSIGEPRLREIVGQVVDRSIDIAASLTNHWAIEQGAPIRPRLAEVDAPTLVMHGTEDPLFPYGHAEALAEEIPGAVLLPLPGVGHQMPPAAVWDVVIPALLRHTSPPG